MTTEEEVQRDEQEYRDLCVEYVELKHLFFSTDRGDYRKMSASLRSSIRFWKEHMNDSRAKQMADLREAQDGILRLQAAAAFASRQGRLRDVKTSLRSRPTQTIRELPGPSPQKIHALSNASIRTIHERASLIKRPSRQAFPFSTIVIIASPWIILAFGGWPLFRLLYPFALVGFGIVVAFVYCRQLLARVRGVR